MLQGTGSDVGKSLLTAGLARAFTRRGLAVRPFKPQNMSNNAAVTADGGEIGRAQALQARACGIEATTDMNPVLLKPQTDAGAQVVVRGRVIGNMTAAAYQETKGQWLDTVLDCFHRLGEGADLLLVEGAGSPAEVNLPGADIANMGFATAARVPVVLIGDIDRGGVIAQMVGTHALLDEAARALLRGFIINRFRGDLLLFDGGLRIIEERTGWRPFGVVPYFADAARLPAEDAVALETENGSAGDFLVVVPRLSRIANFDDIDPLLAEPGVRVEFVAPGQALPGHADLVVLPGSKASRADLDFLRAQGWDIDIAAHVRRGGAVLGLCAGYQMLGRRIADPEGIEGAPGETPGLGLLDIETRIGESKRLQHRAGRHIASGQPVTGYHMHMGETDGPGAARPMLDMGGGGGGAVSADGRVMGCYLHGLFAADGFRHALLRRLGHAGGAGIAYEDTVEKALDGLAGHLETHLDVDGLLETARAA